MPIAQVQYTPVRARRGKLVHITRLHGGEEGRTACNRPCQGWVIATLGIVTCQTCKDSVYLKLRRGR